LKLVKRDSGVDAIVAIFVSPVMIDAYEVARAIAEAADGTKPVLCVFMGKQRSDEGLLLLRQTGVPVYRFPEQAASAMSALARYRKLRDRPRGRTVQFRVSKPKAKAAIASARRAGRELLLPDEAERLLGAYGFPLAPSRVAATLAEAIAAAQELGYPVVLKAVSPRIPHKTDVGGVRVDLRNADEVGRAFRDLTTRLRRHDSQLAVGVQKMVSGGREVILGMTRDAQFGPVLMFGLGGVYVETLRDVSVRTHPLTDMAAQSMIEQVKGYPLLAGLRGEKPVDLKLVRDSLLRLSKLVGDFEGDLQELDLNPFIVGHGVDRSFIVDARVFLTRVGG